MPERTDGLRRAAIWIAIVLVAVGGIFGAVGGSWLVVAVSAAWLAYSLWLLTSTRRTRANR